MLALPAGLDILALMEGIEKPWPPAPLGPPAVVADGESCDRIDDAKKAFLDGPELTKPFGGD